MNPYLYLLLLYALLAIPAMVWCWNRSRPRSRGQLSEHPSSPSRAKKIRNYVAFGLLTVSCLAGAGAITSELREMNRAGRARSHVRETLTEAGATVYIRWNARMCEVTFNRVEVTDETVCRSIREVRGAEQDWRPMVWHFTIHGQPIGDSSLEAIAQLEGVEYLDVGNTKVTDNGLAHLHGQQVNYLNLSHTAISDIGVSHLCTPTVIGTLNLSHTNVGDGIIQHLAGVHGLWKLNLSGTLVSDAALPTLSQFKHLRYVDLSETTITDAGVAGLGGMNKLKGLALRKSKVTDACVEHLIQLHDLEWIDLRDTAIGDDAVRRIRKTLRQTTVHWGPSSESQTVY